MRFGTKVLLLGACLTATPGFASETIVADHAYSDWRAIVLQVEGGEETWRECIAMTGGDGLPVLEVVAREFDAGPPLNYPQVQIREQAPRHYQTLMQEGGRVAFTFDDGDSYSGTAYGDIVEDVFQSATASPHQDDMLFMLQAMRRAGQLDITYEGQEVLIASLSGFTAAYGKIAEACAFSTMGVITPLEHDTGHGGDAGDESTLLFEQFGVWRAQAEVFDNGGVMVTECLASIPSNEARSMSFGVNSLEYFPPDSYPPLMLSEQTAETEVPMAVPGGILQFGFDTGLVVPGELMTNTAHDGIRYVDIAVQSGYRDIALREMDRAASLWVYSDGQVIFETQFDGFSEAYSAIAAACDFTTAGVLP